MFIDEINPILTLICTDVKYTAVSIKYYLDIISITVYE